MSRLIRLKRAEDFRGPEEPGFQIGNYVRLNSGGPVMMVVDVMHEDVVVAWRTEDGISERTFPAPCVHRVDPTV